jgi:multidrug efflux pump subunit AcrA (membrane-fusion protein)
LQALESFKKIVAPFDGVVTARETDIVALIDAGSGPGGGNGPELFRVADIRKMRIYVQVPQQMLARIRPGHPRRAISPLPFAGMALRLRRSTERRAPGFTVSLSIRSSPKTAAGSTAARRGRSPPALFRLYLPAEPMKVHVKQRTVFNALAVDLSQPIPTYFGIPVIAATSRP